METPQLERRWACVLSLDGVGFSRMMTQNDLTAVGALHACRVIIEKETIRRGGRLFGAAGDGFMIEFPSPDGAVVGGMAMQRAIQARNKAAPEAERLMFRAGIASGSVIDDRGNLFGDIVNIAARLQEVCTPGSILVSRNVRDALDGSIDFRRAAELSLKNMPTPIEIFEVMEGDVPLSGAGRDLAAVDVSLVVPGLEESSALAVLPLENQTLDAGNESVCRGFSEDLANLLSRMRQFAVIDRSSAFAFQAGKASAQLVGRRLGVEYIVEGALETDPSGFVVALRLKDTATGSTVWSDRYVIRVDEAQATLDDVALRVSATLGGRIEQAEAARFRSRRESRIGVRGLLWRSRWHLDQLTAPDAEEALRLLQEAEAQDPDNPEVLVQLAHWRWIDAWTGRRPHADVIRARETAVMARNADPRDGRAHMLVGVADILLGRLDEALANLTEALALNPNLALAHAQMGSCFNLKGDYAAAIPRLETSLRLSPRDYYSFYVFGELAISHCLTGDWQRAIAWARKALALRPAYWNARMSEIAALVRSGDLQGAALAYQTLLFRTPKFSRKYIDWLPYRANSVKDFFADAIEQAGRFGANSH